MLKRFKPLAEQTLGQGLRYLPRISPNSITIVGLIPSFLFIYFLSQGRLGWALVCLIGTLFDLIDGTYARLTKQESKFGALLDSATDRVSDAVVISAFSFAQLARWELSITLIIASFLISYLRGRGESLLRNPSVLAVGPIERAERLGILFIALCAYYVYRPPIYGVIIIEWVFIILIALSALTIMRRLQAAYIDLK